MIVEPIYISAVLIGLLGGTHCVGMCGGIVTALTIGLSNQKRNDGRRFFNLSAVIQYRQDSDLHYHGCTCS